MAAVVGHGAEKRSEVSDVRALLNDPSLDSDPLRKRAVLQKVIALVTMGIDTSSLFPDVIRACFTTDLVSKKLIYFFLTSHSDRNPDLALLTINTFLKECAEQSPQVRGLALRSLASLKGIPSYLDYFLPALKRGLSDNTAYVRKIAVLCTVAVFRSSPQDFILHGLYDKVLAALNDTDSQVCVNALEVLLEIAEFDKKVEEEREKREASTSDTYGSVAEGQSGSHTQRKTLRTLLPQDSSYEPSQHKPFFITKAVLFHLLNNLSALNDWQRTQIINLIQQYTPASEEEMFDIMNVVEDHMTGMNSGLVLSCCHALIYLTQNYPAVHTQVLERVRQPLLMLLCCAPNVEASYAVLCHLKLLATRQPAVYSGSCASFFCRYSDPSYVKAVKVEILALVTDLQSAPAVVEELLAVCEDRNATISRLAVEAMGKIALRLPEIASHVLNKFLELMKLGVARLRGTTLVVMKDFLRKYRTPDVIRHFLDALVDTHNSFKFTDEDSRVAFVWVLGEFGEYLEDAPYLLETFTERLVAESPAFRLQTLTSAVTLFFKRPPEMQRLLGRIFQALINDFSNADVLDRAMMYYRLLKEDPTTAAHVICAPKRPITTFVEDQNTDLVDKLFFEEFDSVAVVYGLSAEKFSVPVTYEDEESDGAGSDGEDDHDENGLRDGTVHQVPAESQQQTAALLLDRQGPSDNGAKNMLDSILGATSVVPATAPAAVGGPSPSPSAPSSPAPLPLLGDVDIDPNEFQRQWGTTPTVSSETIQLRPVANSDGLETELESRMVFTLATGGQGGSLKLYTFSATEDSAVDSLFTTGLPSHTENAVAVYFLTEINISPAGAARVTVKTQSPRAKDFVAYLHDALRRSVE